MIRCGYGLAAFPANDVRLFAPETSSLRLGRTVKPIKIRFGSFKIKAKTDEARRETSFYELLGIPETGTLPEIKQAYKQLARKYHPDVSPADRVEEYTKRFIRVQEAYETLSDPISRTLYDRELALGIHFAFTATRRYKYVYNEEVEDHNEWKNRWQSQLSELERRSMKRDVDGNMSWGSRMRRQRDDFSKEH